MLLEDSLKDVSEVEVVDRLIGQGVVVLWIGAYFLLRPSYFNVPFMRAFYIVLELERAFVSVEGFRGELDELLLQLALVQLRTVALLGTHIHLLSDFQQLIHHLLALRVNALSGSCLMDSLKLGHL